MSLSEAMHGMAKRELSANVCMVSSDASHAAAPLSASQGAVFSESTWVPSQGSAPSPLQASQEFQQLLGRMQQIAPLLPADEWQAASRQLAACAEEIAQGLVSVPAWLTFTDRGTGGADSAAADDADSAAADPASVAAVAVVTAASNRLSPPCLAAASLRHLPPPCRPIRRHRHDRRLRVVPAANPPHVAANRCHRRRPIRAAATDAAVAAAAESMGGAWESERAWWEGHVREGLEGSSI